ncbi:MAG: hypothetical protein AVDCRST_MAG75-2137 [uncultured Propionibacteriaceae bacterium]|uniref:Uncharacterized protein n=1 Tax=uncultured Propionibacteriaceae bacterium TaxID=257457 RepID=A0A6J4P4P1_9ACTN|nr:MAG: hypothetical protein AVDCRST_MAG75-2137 [uncultured Propionibacteriaceae bacterium]
MTRVHEPPDRVPTWRMDTTERTDGLLLNGSDPEWVADLLDTMAEGDHDATAEALEGLARRLRKAAKAKHMLGQVPAASICLAFELRQSRAKATRCP